MWETVVNNICCNGAEGHDRDSLQSSGTFVFEIVESNDE